MERKTLADYFLEGGAEGENFMAPDGTAYIFLGFTPAAEGETENRERKMRIKKKGAPGDLEELVETGSHLDDLRVAADLVAGKFYEQVSDGKVLFYDGKSLISSPDEDIILEDEKRTSPDHAKGLIPIENVKAYMAAINEKAGALTQEAMKLRSLHDFMRTYLEGGPRQYDLAGSEGGIDLTDSRVGQDDALDEAEKDFLFGEEETTNEGADDRAKTDFIDTANPAGANTGEDILYLDPGTSLGSESGLLDLDDKAGPVDTGYDSTAIGTDFGDTAEEPNLEEAEADITELDTSVGSNSGSGLSGTGTGEYDVTEDSMAGTASPADTNADISAADTNADISAADTNAEPSLEDNINLDSLGNGSGLLDLSLQSNDTSLGGILDEIYTPEGRETPAESPGDTPQYGAQPPAETAKEELQVTPEEATRDTDSKPVSQPWLPVRLWRWFWQDV